MRHRAALVGAGVDRARSEGSSPGSRSWTSAWQFLVLVVAFGLTPTPSHGIAGIILSNHNVQPVEGGTGFDDAVTLKGVGIRVPQGTDYRFDSFRVLLGEGDGTPRATGGIFLHDGTQTPDAELQRLNTHTVETFFPVLYPFGSPVSFRLEAGRAYWFVVSDRLSAGTFLWHQERPAETPSGVAEFLGYVFSHDGGVSWSNSGTLNAFELHATPVPASSVLHMWAMALTALWLVRLTRTRLRR